MKEGGRKEEGMKEEGMKEEGMALLDIPSETGVV